MVSSRSVNRAQTRIFLGRSFYIRKGVHIPQKDTEPLVNWVSDCMERYRNKIVAADIGTGVGVIAISLALINPSVKKIFAVDVNRKAIKATLKNMERFNVGNRVIPLVGNFLDPICNRKVDLIVVNPPDFHGFWKQVRWYKYLSSVSEIFFKIGRDNKRARRTIKYIKRLLRPLKVRVYTRPDKDGYIRYLRIRPK